MSPNEIHKRNENFTTEITLRWVKLITKIPNKKAQTALQHKVVQDDGKSIHWGMVDHYWNKV